MEECKLGVAVSNVRLVIDPEGCGMTSREYPR
jgi:hypothetical protein